MAYKKQEQMPNEAVIYTPAIEGPYIALLVDLELYFSSHCRSSPKSSAFACEFGIPLAYYCLVLPQSSQSTS